MQTRRQRQETEQLGRKIPEGLVQPSKYLSVNVDDIFQSLKEQSARGEVVELKIVDEKVKTGAGASANNAIDSTIPSDSTTTNESKPSGGPEMITIESSYTFAGKVITEKKEVEIGSAEAKAYLNSTGNIIAKSNESGIARSFVPIVREVDGEHLELRIKLKRPSLIDKFLSIQGNKQQKLSTLEKSRLDWASFVDKRKIQDDLRLHNKDGYLDKQAFLNRVELKKDEQYKKAQDEDRKNRLNNEQQ